MKPCTFYDRNDIGSRYATLKDRSILNREDITLSPEEQELKRQLEEFERHYFECPECRGRLREEQEIRFTLEDLNREGILRTDGRLKPSRPPRWLLIAASFLLLSTISLAAWVAVLKQKAAGLAGPGSPETITRLVRLEPALPAVRTADEEAARIPSSCPSWLLAIRVSKKELAPRRFELRILDSADRELWKDGDAKLDPSGNISLLPAI